MPRAQSSAVATVPTGAPHQHQQLWGMQRRMNQEFERMLRDPFGALTSFDSDLLGGSGGFGRELGQMMPAMDVKDCGDNLCVQCELPGLRKEDVNIELHENQLTISGKRENTWKQEGENWVSQERQWGSFSRSIPVPEGVKPEDITANFGDGVLELKVHKPASMREQRHRIQLQ